MSSSKSSLHLSSPYDQLFKSRVFGRNFVWSERSTWFFPVLKLFLVTIKLYIDQDAVHRFCSYFENRSLSSESISSVFVSHGKVLEGLIFPNIESVDCLFCLWGLREIRMELRSFPFWKFSL